jgi:hypothetical protein
MPKGFDLRCAPGKSARDWLQGKDGGLMSGQALVLFPVKQGETENSSTAYFAPLWKALIDKNERHLNIVVCESDYRALKRGIKHLQPPLQ